MMKRLTLILALTVCLGPVGASADTILAPDMGRSGISGFHSETWNDGLLYVDRIKIGGNARSPLSDIDPVAEFARPWDGAMFLMLRDLPAPDDRPSATSQADALLHSRYALGVNTNANDPRIWEWLPVDESTKTGGWAWAWGHQNLNGRAVGSDHHQAGSAPAGPAVVIPAVVPEPASLVLLGTGLIGLSGAVRRRARP